MLYSNSILSHRPNAISKQTDYKDRYQEQGGAAEDVTSNLRVLRPTLTINDNGAGDDVLGVFQPDSTPESRENLTVEKLRSVCGHNPEMSQGRRRRLKSRIG